MAKRIGTLQFRYVPGRLLAIDGMKISYRDGGSGAGQGIYPRVAIEVTALKIQK